MPKIFQYLQYIIRFYTNEHLPIHVHVQIQDRETNVGLLISGDEITLIFKKVKAKTPISEPEAKEVAVFLKAYFKKIVNKWQMVFIYHKKVRCEIVSKKLRKKV